MDDSGGNLEILTSAVVNTVRHLTQAPAGQKDFLQKISPTGQSLNMNYIKLNEQHFRFNADKKLAV